MNHSIVESGVADTTTVGKVGGHRAYTGRIINLDVDTVRFPDGSTGELEMIRHPGASAVVPFLSDPAGGDPQLLLIRQYRYAAEGYLYEIPAGRLDPGESPEACARRELQEETGCTVDRVERLTTIYTTPGFTDEKIAAMLRKSKKQVRLVVNKADFDDSKVALDEAYRLVNAPTVIDLRDP